MLAVAADWRPGARVRSVVEIMAVPALARYVAGWPREGDFGLVAQDAGRSVGAAWWRLFTPDDCGYGYVDEATPELSIAVVPARQRRGVGTLLLHALIDEAHRSGLPALSLSVDVENRASRLYERLGFKRVRRDNGSVTMILLLAA
jgi:ribosomal protein S18 acetylase RimI-like enzyme